MSQTARKKWIAGEFLIAMPSGPQTRKGFIYRGLGLHNNLGEWTLTHLNSGHSLCSIIADRASAMAIGADIAELGDWSFTTMADVKRGGLNKCAKALIDASPHCYRGDDPPQRDSKIARQIAKARASEMPRRPVTAE